MKRIFLLVLVLSLAACGGYGGGSVNTAQEDFYKGTQGVTARFDHVPNKLYFYRDAGEDGNDFEVGVEIHNQGASWSRGAVFLSGYDPNILYFDEVPLSGQFSGPCSLRLGRIALGELAGIFSCDGVSAGVGVDGNFFVRADSISQLMARLGWNNFPDFSVRGEQIYDQSHFTINFNNPNIDMEYWGHGRFMIGFFSGIDFTNYLGREYTLPGKSYEFPTGDIDYMTYNGKVRPSGWAPGLDEVRQPLLLTNCYFYSTYAAPLVCIDPDPYSDIRKVCSPRHLSFSGSQGAPVAVTSIEQEAGPRESTFRINIQNVGRGEVFAAGELARCSPYIADRVRPSHKNIVYLGDIRIGNQRLINCVPDGVIRLQNGRGTITCTYPYEYAGLQSAYETPLYVELWYGYSETERRDVTIKRVT